MSINLSLIRGDTLPLSIDSISIQGTEEKYILSDTDIIYMDIKRHDYDQDAVVRKTLTAKDYDNEGRLNFIIFPSDTENLPFGEYVSMADIEPYFTNLNETASVLKIYEDGQQYIYIDYVILIKCSKEYFEGSANPRIIMVLGQLSETDKTLRDIAPQKIYTGTQLDIAKAKKIDEMDRKCRDTIYGGTLVPLSSGIAERFTLDEQDQLNLSGIALKILMGAETISWHTNDKSEHCVFYSADDARAIISTLTAFKEYHITYFRDLRIFINALTEIDAINGIEYGYLLPEEYKSDVLKQMEAMM